MNRNKEDAVTKPLISIIVPVYNVEKYLRRCIDSILQQRFSDFELILVNDGSADRSGDICEQYARLDSRIKVFHQANRGLSEARNTGLKIAIGQYVYFCDSDDYVEPNLFEMCLPYLEKNMELVTFGNCAFWDDGRKEEFVPESASLNLYDMAERLNFIIQKQLTYKVGWEAWSAIYKRSIIEESGLRFVDTKKIFAEDILFRLCYLTHASSIAVLPQSLYNYYQRSNSLMGVGRYENKFNHMNELSKAYCSYIQEKKGSDDFAGEIATIHYQLMDNVIERAKQNHRGTTIVEMRKLLFSEIEDYQFFKRQMLQLFFHKKRIYSLWEEDKANERMVEVLFYLTNNQTLCSWYGLILKYRTKVKWYFIYKFERGKR